MDNDSERPAIATPPRLGFVKAQHLRRPAEFERVYDGKVKAGDDRLLVFAAVNDLGWTRVGLSVSRKHGGSVRRQRLKRLLREAFRLAQHDLPAGWDLILIPRPASNECVDGYQQSLRELTRRLRRKLPSASAPSVSDGPTQSQP